MTRYFLLLLILCILPITSWSQDTDLISIDNNDLSGATVSNMRVFNGSSLFGYMDGGAELYLEYGFSAARISDVDYGGEKYKTEIFKMNGPEEAFGIFSASRFKCRSTPPLSHFTCMTRYQLQVCSGQYYISIINRSGNKIDSIASIRIGDALVKKINQPSFDLKDFVRGISENTDVSAMVLAKGKLGIINGAPDWEDLFTSLNGFTVLIIPGNEKTIFSLRLDNPGDLEKFRIINAADIQNIKLISDKHILFEIKR